MIACMAQYVEKVIFRKNSKFSTWKLFGDFKNFEEKMEKFQWVRTPVYVFFKRALSLWQS